MNSSSSVPTTQEGVGISSRDHSHVAALRDYFPAGSSARGSPGFLKGRPVLPACTCFRVVHSHTAVSGVVSKALIWGRLLSTLQPMVTPGDPLRGGGHKRDV